MSPEKRAYLSALGKARWAARPKDAACAKCGEPIVSDFTFCKPCWQALPDMTREAILAACEPGVRWGWQTGEAYRSAVEEACR